MSQLNLNVFAKTFVLFCFPIILHFMTSRHFLISLRMSSTILHVLHENQPPRYRNKYFASTFALYVLQFNFGMCIKKVTTYLIYIIKRKVCIRINSFYMIINVDLQQISAYIRSHRFVLFYLLFMATGSQQTERM